MAKSIKKEKISKCNAFEEELSVEYNYFLIQANTYYNRAFQRQALMAYSENGFYTCFLVQK